MHKFVVAMLSSHKGNAYIGSLMSFPFTDFTKKRYRQEAWSQLRCLVLLTKHSYFYTSDWVYFFCPCVYSFKSLNNSRIWLIVSNSFWFLVGFQTFQFFARCCVEWKYLSSSYVCVYEMLELYLIELSIIEEHYV